MYTAQYIKPPFLLDLYELHYVKSVFTVSGFKYLHSNSLDHRKVGPSNLYDLDDILNTNFSTQILKNTEMWIFYRLLVSWVGLFQYERNQRSATSNLMSTIIIILIPRSEKCVKSKDEKSKKVIWWRKCDYKNDRRLEIASAFLLSSWQKIQ